MIIETTKENGFTIATIAEAEASLKNSDDFKAAIIALIEEGQKRIIISFEKVTYIDSSFLGALVSSLKYAMSHQTDLSISDLKKDIDALFQLTRIDKVFKIYNTAGEALAVKST